MKLSKRGKPEKSPAPEKASAPAKATPPEKRPADSHGPRGFMGRLFRRREGGLDRLSKEIEKTATVPRTSLWERLGLKRAQKDEQKDALKKEARKVKQRLLQKERIRHRMKYYLNRAGIFVDERFVSRRIFYICLGINSLVSLYLIVLYASTYRLGAGPILLWMFLLWGVCFAGLLFVTWMTFMVYLDLRMHQRTQMIEQVFPDFLQLASANIRAGMPLDRALWFAVRPQFGILSKEIEEVAKETLSGTDLESALRNFASKYDSPTVGRAITLLVEGMNSGGEVGELLNKIAINIQESQILRKEMAADVMSYSLFIGIAAVLAAPFLFALSGQLLIILKGILGTVAQGGAATSGSGGFQFSFSEITLTAGDFNKFAVLTLCITSTFSGIIIATIRKGDVKSGLSIIPIFAAVTIMLYLIASKGLGIMLGGFIG